MSNTPNIGTGSMESSHFLRAALDALSAHIAILDEKGTIIKVNAAWSRFGGKNHFKGSQFGLGQNYLKTCESAANSPEAAAVAGNIRAIMNGHGGEFTLEYPCHAPREQRWFLARITRFDGDGPLRVVVAHENITARKRAELALQTGERRLRLALQAGGLGAFEYVVEKHLSVVSPEFCQIFGRPFEPIFTHEEWVEKIHPEDRSWVHEQVRRMVQEVRPLDIEYRLCLPGGVVRWIRAMAHPEEADGSVETAHGVVQDITKRKQAEAELRQFSIAAEQSPVSIVITDLQGGIEYVNPKFCAVTGYSLEDVRGRNPRVLKSGEMPREHYRQMWETLAAGGEWHGEFHNRKKNGDLYWESASLSCIRDSQGKITRFIAIKEDITARRQAAQDLADSKQFLDRIINSVSEPIFVKDRQHRYVLMNAAYSAWLGHSLREIIGKTSRDFYPQEEADLFSERDEEIFTTGQESVYEETISDTGGNARQVLTRKNRFSNARGDMFLVGALHDITQSKKLETALRESAHRQRAILDNIPDPAWLRDRAGHFLMVNQAWCNLAGITATEAAGKKIEEVNLFPADIASRLNKEDEMVMSSGKISQRDLRLEFAGHGSVWFEVIKTPLVDEAGHIYGVAGIARDITVRMRHAEIQKEQIALREHLAKVAANVPGIIYSYRLRPDGSVCIPYISPTVEEFCRVRPEAVASDASPLLDLIPAEDRARTHGSIAESARTMTPWRAEFRLRHPQRGLFWVEAQSTPEREPDGSILWHGFMSDISARKRADQELAEHKENEDRARRELEREHGLNLIKSRFVSLVSHEFRTPLCAINMAAFMLSDYSEGMTHEERSEHARNIQQSVGRMTGMMEDFLTHDKVQAGKLQCQPAWMELAVFCQELIAEVVSTLDAGRHVECTIDPAAQRVFLDRKILRHIISNLLSNAVKYSTADQSVFIEVERTQPGSQKAGEPVPPPGEFLQFKVRDTGIGIPAEDLTRLYQTFHRAANVGNRPGTGMGLAIVKQFVDLHGGTIRVESREGKGSSFWVWLPIAAPRAQDNSGPTVPAVAKSSEP